MKALVWKAAEVMEMDQVERPQARPGEAVIDVGVVGICGSEIEGYLGHNSLRIPPLVMGHEICGRVASEVPGMNIGQKVVINPLLRCGNCRACRNGAPQLCETRTIIGIHRPGGFAEQVLVPISNLFAVPEHVDQHRMALTEPLACALRATRRALEGNPFANVVIFGAGGIGLLCLQTAIIFGARRVTVIDTNNARLDMAVRVGANAVLNPRDVNLHSDLSEILDGGIDVVIDAAGFQATRETAMRLLNPGGTFMNIGLGIDETSLPINYLIRNEIRILGSFCYNDDDFHQALQLLVDGRVSETGWTERRPLAAGGEAFEELVAGRVNSGKILLEVSVQ